MLNDDNNPPIYPNSINRVIIIDKIEYFLSYQHGRINKYSGISIEGDSDVDMGRMSLIAKIGNKEEGTFYQHKCEQSKLILTY
jgi:hypothetical protein